MKRYAFSDLHGNYNLWKQIQNYITDEDEVYCLGDICDRGPDGIKIMKEIFQDKRFTCLVGNHEIMLVDAINAFTLDKEDLKLMKYNGQLQTFIDLLNLSDKEQEEICNKIESLPYVIMLDNGDKMIYLIHAGISAELLATNLELNDVTKKSCIWNRAHIAEPHWNIFMDNTYLIHGHTPVQSMGLFGQKHTNKDEIVKYCDNHKIDIDLGTPSTNKIALLDLDTFEPIYFTDTTIKN